jgi:hypothetical protein
LVSGALLRADPPSQVGTTSTHHTPRRRPLLYRRPCCLDRTQRSPGFAESSLSAASPSGSLTSRRRSGAAPRRCGAPCRQPRPQQGGPGDGVASRRSRRHRSPLFGLSRSARPAAVLGSGRPPRLAPSPTRVVTCLSPDLGWVD